MRGNWRLCNSKIFQKCFKISKMEKWRILMLFSGEKQWTVKILYRISEICSQCDKKGVYIVQKHSKNVSKHSENVSKNSENVSKHQKWQNEREFWGYSQVKNNELSKYLTEYLKYGQKCEEIGVYVIEKCSKTLFGIFKLPKMVKWQKKWKILRLFSGQKQWIVKIFNRIFEIW